MICWQQFVLTLAVLFIFSLKSSWCAFKIHWTEYHNKDVRPILFMFLYIHNACCVSISGGNERDGNYVHYIFTCKRCFISQLNA